MSRVKLHGVIRNKNLPSSENPATDLTGGNTDQNEAAPNTFEKLNPRETDFLTIRRKVKLQAKKKRHLVKLNQKKAQAKSERILQLRKEKLEKFRIDYIPLGSDEDWEMMAAFYSKNSKK